MVNLDDFIGTLQKSLKLSDEFCDQLKTMSYAGSKQKLVYELKIEDEFESKYGYIAMAKDPSGHTFSCAYAIHSMMLKLQLRTVETREKKYLLNFFEIDEEVTYTKEKGK